MVRFWLTQRVCEISLGGWVYFLLRPLRGSSAQRMYHLQASGIWKGGNFHGRIQGRGPGGPSPTPLFLDQTEARSAEKNFGKTTPHPPPLPCLFQGLDPGLISLVKVYKKSKETVMSVWKRPERANRYTSWLTVKKSRKRFLVWFVYVWETVHLQKLKRMQRSKLGM